MLVHGAWCMETIGCGLMELVVQDGCRKLVEMLSCVICHGIGSASAVWQYNPIFIDSWGIL